MGHLFPAQVSTVAWDSSTSDVMYPLLQFYHGVCVTCGSREEEDERRLYYDVLVKVDTQTSASPLCEGRPLSDSRCNLRGVSDAEQR